MAALFFCRQQFFTVFFLRFIDLLVKHSKKLKLVTKAKILSHFPCSFFSEYNCLPNYQKQNLKA